MQIIKKSLAVLAAVVLVPAMISAKTVVLDFTKKNQKNALVRSILVPSWGQFFEGNSTKGYVVLCGAALSAAAAFYYSSESDKAYDDYKRVGLMNSDQYSDYTNKSNSFTLATLSLVAFWLYGIIDAYFISSPDEYAAHGDKDKYARHDGLRLNVESRDVRVVFSKLF